MTQGRLAARDRHGSWPTRDAGCGAPRARAGRAERRWRSGEDSGSGIVRNLRAAVWHRMPPRWSSAWTPWPPRCAARRSAHPRSATRRRVGGAGGRRRTGWAAGAARPDCAAGERPAATPVVIHVIAEQAGIQGGGSAPASEVGADELIDPDLFAELAASAKLVPLMRSRRRPGRTALHAVDQAGRLRACRDLTCRAPGCDRPAVDCDLDHTIPYADGGVTHPSNLKCLCRQHHLLQRHSAG